MVSSHKNLFTKKEYTYTRNRKYAHVWSLVTKMASLQKCKETCYSRSIHTVHDKAFMYMHQRWLCEHVQVCVTTCAWLQEVRPPSAAVIFALHPWPSVLLLGRYNIHHFHRSQKMAKGNRLQKSCRIDTKNNYFRSTPRGWSVTKNIMCTVASALHHLSTRNTVCCWEDGEVVVRMKAGPQLITHERTSGIKWIMLLLYYIGSSFVFLKRSAADWILILRRLDPINERMNNCQWRLLPSELLLLEGDVVRRSRCHASRRRSRASRRRCRAQPLCHPPVLLPLPIRRRRGSGRAPAPPPPAPPSPPRRAVLPGLLHASPEPSLPEPAP